MQITTGKCLSNRLSSHLIIVVFVSIFILLVSVAIAEKGSSEKSVHIIYTEQPPTGDVKAHHIKTLANVLGSEKAAKKSLLYVYKNAANGFSASLTEKQVEELRKQPGVLQVIPSQTVNLHDEHSGGYVLH